MMKSAIAPSVFTLFVMLAAALGLHAQSSTATLSGRVTDPSGAAVPNATVAVTGATGNVQVAVTGVDGRYSVSNLAAGEYTARASAAGFALFEKTGLRVSGKQTLDIRLSLDVAKEQVTVSDTPTVDTQPSSNAGAIVLKGDDLDALSDNPDDLESDLQALAGPSVGPNGGQIYIDGFSGGQLPPKASIREIRINQNPFSAEFDRLGFGRIEIFTKPGTDKYHGQAFFNFGDSRFNSRNPFAPDKPGYQMKMFDFNLGGPMTKKSSFFFNAERQAVDETSVVSALTLDPSSFEVGPYSASILNPRTRTRIGPRLDYQLSPNNTLVARYDYSRTSHENEGVGELSLASRAYNSAGTDHELRITETAVLNPNTINETRFQYIRRHDDQTALNTDAAISVLGAFSGGGATIGRSYSNQNRYEVENSTSMTRGAHLLKIGARLRTGTDAGYSSQGYNGAFTFTSLNAYRITLEGLQNGLTAAEIRAAGGGPSQFSITGGNPLADVSQTDLGIFVQDDWKLRQNFTLSLGLRYETQNNIRDHLDFAPRVGFAWGLARKGSIPRTVIRGGFGLFYDRVDDSLTLQAERLNGINQQQFIVPFPEFFPNVPAITALSANRLPSAIRELSRTLQAPYVAQGVLSVERQLPKNITLAVTYAQSRGLHVLRSRNINAPLPGTWSAADPAAALRPYGNIGDIYLYESGGIYKQRQLITNINARVSPKLMLFGFYVLGKAEGNADGASDFPANQYDLTSEWGRSSFDVRHRVVLGGSIAAPFGLRFNPFVMASSGRPFDIVVGRDLNGDSQFNDRPAFATDLTRANVMRTAYGIFDLSPLPGQALIPRNYGSGPGQFTINMRVSKTFSFGGERRSTAAGDQGGPSGPRMIGGPGMGGARGPVMRGGGGPRGGPGGMFGESGSGRYNLTLSASARNLLNNVNLGMPIGNLTSPLFGTSNSIAAGFGPGGASATANRRIEFQLRFSF